MGLPLIFGKIISLRGLLGVLRIAPTCPKIAANVR
jgi:hypothetical protein